MTRQTTGDVGSGYRAQRSADADADADADAEGRPKCSRVQSADWSTDVARCGDERGGAAKTANACATDRVMDGVTAVEGRSDECNHMHRAIRCMGT